ncbi:DUF2303 family protein [Rhodobacter capsulatus]|jgi:hypothetical protein|uniref:DUF2303-containing protein n=1 Tax=Rhodobacter phage RcapNL TaxID=1131316 RepID=H6WBP5_9CAUD|nr:DUF2303 family protein [Rhodobacter capsulatus]YP_007518424.1 DUF2303 family protein [Rhodobacter phage RcapNL]AFA44882.1 DUF2303-containing protein [Rhodobacter phage RcapNL]ETD02746.1 hypothetical protein U714_04380 [Rhodobacter capsulatus DE442]ETD78903.1 hypothetical protein U717_04385 [Rhodobacter capsulatus R121]ETE54882.1 hypothetical protein U715_04375 [Rhodobacter capsulatus Y262]MDS0926148.1 YfdQ family protein [Rhodobacter capsulatus]
MTEQNIAETFFEHMGELGSPAALDLDQLNLEKPALVAVPTGYRTEDIRAKLLEAAELHKPLARRGTATIESLNSLIEWTNRHKGSGSVIFAHATDDARSLTTVIDYHLAGAPSLNDDGDPLARHGKHRARYDFPLSKEWRAWSKVCGAALTGPELGEFLEDRAEDVLNPTPAILGTAGSSTKIEPWEATMIELAAKLGGRFGSFASLKTLADEFKMNESTGIVAKTNRDTGETTIQFVNEHKAPDGSPISVPTLFMIAIPVFEHGPAYRLAVRIRYRRAGSGVAWILSLYNPQAAMDDAWTEALHETREKTGLPVFDGKPEA